MRRLTQILSAQLSDDKQAAKVTFAFSDGTTEDIEIVRGATRGPLQAIMSVCHAFGEAAPQTRPLTETTPAQAVLLPTEEMATSRMDGGGLWLMFRVGSQDVSVALPDPKSAESLADALLHPK
jgi:hypothetical protein